jgi:hypothetical protein
MNIREYHLITDRILHFIFKSLHYMACTLAVVIQASKPETYLPDGNRCIYIHPFSST